MKYVISFFAGILIGVLLFVVGLYYNPLTNQQGVSPLAVSSNQVVELGFSAVPGEAILFTNDGESTLKPYPNRVAELWEPAIRDTSIFVTVLRDSRDQLAGIGIKTSTKSEATELLYGNALTNSDWHLYLPSQGTMMINQSENLWSYIREIVVPARMSSGDNWKGMFHGITTAGPGALGTARVSGGSGRFAGLDSESVESLSARAYSAVDGPVSMNGALTVTLPTANSKLDE